MATKQITAEELFSNKEWRDDVNEAAGRKLTCTEMWTRAQEAAEHLNEEASK